VRQRSGRLTGLALRMGDRLRDIEQDGIKRATMAGPEGS
jgi:hypothetical protein